MYHNQHLHKMHHVKKLQSETKDRRTLQYITLPRESKESQKKYKKKKITAP